MKFVKLLFSLMLVSIVLFSFETVETSFSKPAGTNDTIQFQVPPGWPEPKYDFTKNPLTTKGIELGRKLFYDNNLSRDSSISCAGCHLSYTNFTHIDHKLSHGINDRIGTRNTLAIINPAWQSNFMWDGGVTSLDAQPLAPLTSAHEMDMSMDSLMARLKRSKEYKEMFKQAFGSKGEVSGYYLFRAFSQFMLTFNTYNSKYDKVMRKEAGFSFSEREEKGLNVFRTHCESCHTEPLFTNLSYQNNGLPVNPKLNDGGRIKITKNPKDSLKFKVPSLRNIEVSYPYMHDGRFKNLQSVLIHYSLGIVDSETLAPQLKGGIDLTEDEKRNLVIFLKTLTDETYLRSRELGYPHSR